MKPYYEDGYATIYHGDCREILPSLDKVDLVLTDPPYGITSNGWDISLDLVWFWSAVDDCAKESAAFVITASEPFGSLLVCANLKHFKHEWIWIKNRGSNFANTVREPFKEHESVKVFSKGGWTYNPQRQERTGGGLERVKYSVEEFTESENYRKMRQQRVFRDADRKPSSWQKFNTEVGLHPTQKPLPLFRYLCCTYSNEGETILDPFMGSGTTLRAAKDLNRKCIGIELEERYCEIAANRLSQEVLQLA